MYKSQVRRSIVAIHPLRLFSFPYPFQLFPHASGWIDDPGLIARRGTPEGFSGNIASGLHLYHPMETLHDGVHLPFSSMDPAYSDAFAAGVFVENSPYSLQVCILFSLVGVRF